MLRILILISTFSMLAYGQPGFKPSKDQQVKAYSQVIAEYIKAVSKTNKFHFDTLFITNHSDLPKIKLPEMIHSKKIVLLNYGKSDKKPENSKSFVVINIAEQKFTKDKAAFILVAFHKGYHPQHNCYIDLKYNSKKRNYELDKKVMFKYPYAKK